ncbi:MAG: sigma-54-dependent Fis family transcriptional regulator, partial [Candidatus Wallbacteria bacterium]|nr:sigma-54-dependent Fis family transcriptional regulator [Candidatus Wallbacteria bacterium]
PQTEVVMMTAYASVPKAVEAIQAGAYDYIQKPFDPDDVVRVIERAVERKRLREQATSLRRELDGVRGFANLLGKNQAMLTAYQLLEKAGRLDFTVLITGETGTGKELAARAVHDRSARRDRPFVAVNCGALPAELVESELFGHARGAFTGASFSKPGLFNEADGGTLFFDEIGELPLAVQVKFNRVLQEKEIRRVGENAPAKVDVRIVAATHRDLKAEAAAGRFREDLFYRLNVFPIHLPALRDRAEDIPLLTAHFLEKVARAHRRETMKFTAEALRALTSYSWPGNVRELENAIERAVAVSSGTELGVECLPEEVRRTRDALPPGEILAKSPYREVVVRATDHVSREYLVALLQEFRGNVTRAAERAGLERGSLHRLLKRFGLRSDDFKRSSE